MLILRRNPLVNLSPPSMAILAADLGIAHGLPMADSMIYAVAKSLEAQVVTLDRHFRGLELAEVVDTL